MAIHLRTMAKPLSKKWWWAFWPTTFNQHAFRARERYRHAFQRERLGISLPPVFCRLKIAQEDEGPVSWGQASPKSEVFRGSIVPDRPGSSETVTAGPG